MSSFTFFLLCLQACLIQNAYSQCYGPARYDAIAPGLALAPGAMAPMTGYGVPAYAVGAELTAIPAVAAYGGAGVGDVAVAGEMPVAGTTLVAGQVPILGAVRFAGDLPAAGTVTIAGSCGCGCGAPAYYY